MQASFNLEKLADDLRQHIHFNELDNPVMIGIHTGGVWIAEQLHKMLNLEAPLGTLDISFYRDDFTRKGINPEVQPSNLPFEVTGADILLVDDVLHTGRTIRAAMNEIFDYGRPASIALITLAERNGRELPIEPTIVGEHYNLSPDQHIKLSGPDPLKLEILE